MSAVIFAPWLGVLPWYAHWFFESVRHGRCVTWVVHSDQPAPIEEKNLIWIETDRESIAQRAQMVTGRRFDLKLGHQLCDLRPAYAAMWPEHVAGATWWGWSDWDVSSRLDDVPWCDLRADEPVLFCRVASTPLLLLPTSAEWLPTDWLDCGGSRHVAFDELIFLPQIEAGRVTYLQDDMRSADNRLAFNRRIEKLNVDQAIAVKNRGGEG